MTDQPRMVKLTELWERESKRGTRYFSGFLGDAQLLMFDGGLHPDRDGVRVWRLLVQERDPARRPATRKPEQCTPLAERHELARRARELTSKPPLKAAADDDDPPFSDDLPFG